MAQISQSGVQGSDFQCLHELVNVSPIAAPFEYLMSAPAAILQHVAIYVVTADEHAIVQASQKKAGRRGHVDVYKAFGGCKHPNNVFRMINSLRLELLDEGSLTPDARATWSPLFIYKDVLLQVVCLEDANQEFMDSL